MARIQNPIIGRAKGQAGGMVFTTLNGKNILKAKAYSYRDQNTEVQQENRRINTLVVRLAAALKLIARSLFLVQPTEMPAYSRLIQQFQAGVNRTNLPYLLQMVGKELGSGNIEVNARKVAYSPVTGELAFEWDTAPFASGTDLSKNVKCFVFNQLTGEIYLNGDSGSEIVEESGGVTLPVGTPAANLAFFLIMEAGDSGSELQKNVKRCISVA